MDKTFHPSSINTTANVLKPRSRSRVGRTTRGIERSDDLAAQLAQMQERYRIVENALLDGEDRYQMLLDGVDEYAIYMVNLDGIVVSWNSGAERIQGYLAHEIIGRNFSCFFSQEDIRARAPEDLLRMAAKTGRRQEYAVRVRKDGSRFLASVTLTALRDAAGELWGFSEFSHNLSENNEAGAKYLETAPEAMLVVNPEGEIVLLNLQAEKQFGYHRDELLGRKVEKIIPCGLPGRLISNDLRSASETIAQRVGAGVESTARRKDGSEFPIEVVLSSLKGATKLLVTVVIRDISAQREAERRLAQMEGRYRGLLEAAPDAMVVTNVECEIVLLNRQAERQFGYHRDELLGQRVTRIIPHGFEERLIADSLRSADDAEARQIGGGIELTGKRKDGGEFPVEIMLSLFDSAEGVLITAAIRDISTRKQAEAQLQQMSELERTQSEFVSTVSHELRTPLTSIGGSLALIAAGAAGVVNDRAGRLIQIANNNTQRLIGLVNDILDIEKLQSGRMVFQFTPVRIDDVVDQAIAENQAYAARFGIELRRVGVESNVTMSADSGRLNQAVTNLISNAVKFSATGAYVEISAFRTETGVRISVADHGAGIPEEFRRRIFERFAQADSSDIRQKGGSGLGLNIVREFVRRHGGSVSFESVVDSGSTFNLDFPLAGGLQLGALSSTAELQVGRAIVCALNAEIANPICGVLRANGFECDAVFTDGRLAASGEDTPSIIDAALARDDLGGIVRAFRDGGGVDHFPLVLLCVEPTSLGSDASKLGSAGGERALKDVGDLSAVRRRDRLSILHIEDDYDLLEVVRESFQGEFTVVSAPTMESARRHLVGESFDLIILDLTLSDGLGADLIPHLIDAAGRPIPIVVFTAQDSSCELAGQVETFLTKSRDNLATLAETVRTAIAATGRGLRGNQEKPYEAA